MTAELFLDDARLVLGVRIAQHRLHEEPVELRLRQRERSFVLDRVLGRHDEERILEQARLAVDGDLLLGHRLEEGGLRLWHCAVDLVDEDDVREDGAGPELEVALALVEDGEAGDVGRLEIRRALDARRHGAPDGAGDCAREDGLRGAGHVFEERVAAAHERCDDELDLLALAVHDGLDVVEEPLRDVRWIWRQDDLRVSEGNDEGSLRVRHLDAARAISIAYRFYAGRIYFSSDARARSRR